MAVPLLRALFRSDSASAETSAESSPSPVEALCRVFCVLAAGALLSILVSAGVCALMPGPDGRGRLVLAFGLIGLLLLAGAVYSGLRMVRQALLDSRQNSECLLEAKQRALELAALYDTSHDVSVQYELSTLLQTILERAKNLLSAAGCAIFLYDSEHHDFEIAAEVGVGMPVGSHLPMDRGPAGHVARTREPLILKDYGSWPDRSEYIRKLPIKSTVLVPMMRGGELVGVLGVHELVGTSREFNEADARLLSLFADNAASAVRVARLLEAVRDSEERFRIAARCASDIVYDWDLADDSVVFFGARYDQLRAENQTVARTRQEFWDTLHPDDLKRVRKAFHGHLESGTLFSEEYRISDGKGSYLVVSDRAMAIRNQKGKAVRLIGAVTDITERKRAEQMKTDFVSFVTHQLRTPLSGVKWMLELAMETLDNPEEMQSFVRDARISTDRLIGLVNDLLDVSRLERGSLKVARRPIDLAGLTREVVAELDPLVKDKRQRFSVLAPEGLPEPWVDPQLIRQAVLNLIANAVKYTPEEGEIRVRIEAGDGGLRWEIRDTGIGIPPADMRKLFEKFYRAGNVLAVETEGTGLGLYLVRLIVERFGGKVWCESEEGVGSTFMFTLPLENGEV
ncbi:MAG: GAF domain-containing protein [Acidobacteria bacterium]|nr:GAF domain-containing protein [Acidobacteriota bacterium]